MRLCGKIRSLTPCCSESAASASALGRSISASAKAASNPQACCTMAFISESRASHALSENAFSGAIRLVEARRVIERCHAVEPEGDVGAGSDKFGAVDQTRLHAGEDLPG